jgi:RNA polymerase sigma factor (sigma-70 family)
MTGAGEVQLLDRFLAEGDEQAFGAILRRHGPMVLGVCRRILSDPNDVEDAFQATFLILVRKAGSIGDRSVLGPWLHGVARRVAVRARVNARRRREREREGLEMAACPDHRSGPGDTAELRAILDREVGGLREKYRSALVLCDLEGCSQEQAAVRLGCPVGTVKSRLTRAREKLGSRLARRGLAPSAGLLASTLAPEPASALTADLLGSTIRAAARLHAGRAIAAGTVSAVVAALVEQTSRSMSMNIVKVVTAVLTAGLIAAGAGVSAYQEPGRKQAGIAIDPRTKQAGTRVDPVTETFKAGLPGPAPGDGNPAPRAEPRQAVASLAQARYQEAARMFEWVWATYKSNHDQFSRPAIHSWALKVLEARRDLGDTKADRIAAAEDYLKVWQEVEKRVKPEDKDELAVVHYYRTEAELWLAQARAGKEPGLSGSPSGGLPGSSPGARPGSDARSQELLARLEETIPMSFPNPTPLEDVLKYIRQATAGPDRESVPIYVDPVNPEGDSLDDKDWEKLRKTPITINLEGVPLRRTLKLIAEQLGMGYGIKDGMVTFAVPNMVRRNWSELLVMEESFPQSSPLELEVERARRGELTTAELDQLNERLKAIEEVTKRSQSIRMMRLMPGASPGGMMRAMPGPSPGPQTKPQ